jgi:hypothetical protein
MAISPASSDCQPGGWQLRRSKGVQGRSLSFGGEFAFPGELKGGNERESDDS